METRAPFVVVGAFVLAAIAAVFGFVYWLQNAGGLGPRTSYYVQFEGSEVLVCRAIAVGLTAKTAGLQVRYMISGCSASGYVRATSIEVWN